MKLLILVRHGNYNEYSGELSLTGLSQIQSLTEKLKELTRGMQMRVHVLTSPAVRARDSADIICKAFGVIPNEYDELWSDEDHVEDFRRLLEIVKANQDFAEILILVTHVEYAEEFPWYYVKEMLGKQINSGSIQRGEACVVDCLSGSTKIISYR